MSLHVRASSPQASEDERNAKLREILGSFCRIIAICTALGMLALALVCLRQEPQPRAWFLLVYALGAAGGGATLGFLYATVGKEEERFQSSLSVTNGLVGGLAISDIAGSDSVIARVLRSLARGAGLPENGGLVFAILVAFGAAGFLAMYQTKRLFLNLLGAKVDMEIREYDKQLAEESAPAEPGKPPEASPKLQEAAREKLEAEEGPAPAGDSMSVKAAARALYVSGRYAEARPLYERLVRLAPGDVDAVLDLSNVHLIAEGHEQAIRVLEQYWARNGPDGRVAKYLGYAYLFVAGRAADALRYTEYHLKDSPDDPGALLNRACALSQLHATNERPKADVISAVKAFLALAPQGAARIRELMEPGEDFAHLRDDDELNALLQPAAAAMVRPGGPGDGASGAARTSTP